MCVNSDQGPVDIRVQGQCTINCILFWVVHMVDAISWGPMFGLRNYREWIYWLNMG